MKKINVLMIAAVSSLLLFSGCIDQKAAMLQQGFPLAYTEGFDDGCHSGRKAGGSLFDQFKKDVERFNSEDQYAQGWSDGFRQCETEQEAIQRNMRIGIEQQKLNEQRKQNKYEREYHLQGIDTSNFKYLK